MRRLNMCSYSVLSVALSTESQIDPAHVVIAYCIVGFYTWIATVRMSAPYTINNALFSRVFLGIRYEFLPEQGFPLRKSRFLAILIVWWCLLPFVCCSGLFVVGLATVSSFGFMGIIQYPLAPASHHMVIFLSLALGMHTVYQFIHHLNNHSHEADIDARMKVSGAISLMARSTLCSISRLPVLGLPQRTLETAGLPVFITHFVHATVFLIASTVDIQLVQYFMAHMGTLHARPIP